MPICKQVNSSASKCNFCLDTSGHCQYLDFDTILKGPSTKQSWFWTTKSKERVSTETWGTSEKKDALARSATSNQKVARSASCCVAQVVYNWVRRHVFPGWPEPPTFKNRGGHTHHVEHTSYWNWTETGHPLRLDCTLSSWKTEILKDWNILIPPRHCWSTAVNKLVGYVKPPNQRTFGTPAEQQSTPRLWCSKCSNHPKPFVTQCLCWTPPLFWHFYLYSVIVGQPICWCYLAWQVSIKSWLILYMLGHFAIEHIKETASGSGNWRIVLQPQIKICWVEYRNTSWIILEYKWARRVCWDRFEDMAQTVLQSPKRSAVQFGLPNQASSYPMASSLGLEAVSCYKKPSP